MKTITRIALLLAIAGATFAACDRHASASTDECARAMSAAEASAFTAARKLGACLDPDECRVAREMVAASQAQLAAARAMCGEPAPASASNADPFDPETVAQLDPDAAAWLAVYGDATADECGGVAP